MGKTRNRKIRRKINPLGTRSDNYKPILLGNELSSERPIEAIREQLISHIIDDKINGLQALAVLSEFPEKVFLLCSADIVRIAAPLICEQNECLKNAAICAFRNLSVCGAAVCEMLVQRDVLTPLFALLKQYAEDETWLPTFHPSFAGQLDIKSDTFLQAIHLLWNLCESTPSALDDLNQTTLVKSFIRCLDHNVFGSEIAITVAQCIFTISEDNLAVWNEIQGFTSELLLLLNVSGEHAHTLIRTLAAGIISNVPSLAVSNINRIYPALSMTLGVDHREILLKMTIPSKSISQFIVQNDSMEINDDENNDTTHICCKKTGQITDSNSNIKNIEHLLDAQRIAAEIILNQCSLDEGNEEVVTSDLKSNYKEADAYENKKRKNILLEFLEAIKSTRLVEKLWEKAQPISENVNGIPLNQNLSTFRKVRNLRISSMLSLQNLCNLLCTEDLGGSLAIYNVWVNLGEQIFKDSEDMLLVESSTSLMRSVLCHLKYNRELFNQISHDDLQLMFNRFKQWIVPEIRANWLRMLGTLGYILLNRSLAKGIMTFLLEVSLKEEDVWVMSEGIDALMDMFFEDDWNEEVIDLNLNERIKELEGAFVNLIKQQKGQLKERYAAVLTVRSNLNRFIKYLNKE